MKEDNEARVPFVYHCFKIDTTNNYWEYALNTKFNDKQLKRLISSGARMDGLLNISFEAYGSITINVPSSAEQTKIANFLNLIEERINTQNKIIEQYESLIISIRNNLFRNNNWEWEKLKTFIDDKTIELQRGNIIPKHQKDDHTFIYPVYSSSVQRYGLMGYFDSYMFDEDLITWSIDGGGNFFLRNKHKFNVTNVCGILKLKKNIFDYSFLYEVLCYQHSKMVFDYQTKAHPSVIQTLYSLPLVPFEEQVRIGCLFKPIYKKVTLEKSVLEKLKIQKEYLLRNLFI